MILKIVPEIVSDMPEMSNPNIKLLDYRMFNDLSMHPFIATRRWDEVIVVLGKGIRTGFIKQVLTRANITTLVVPKDTVIDFAIISHVIEVYPSISGELRKMFMSKQDVIPRLKEEGVLFG